MKNILFLLLIMSHISYGQFSEAFQNAIDEQIIAGLTPSISAAIIDSDGIQFYAYGKTELNNGQEANENTVYEIGSITKIFNALILAQMVQEKKLSLDENITKYLPKEFAYPKLKKANITLKQLATHSSGLPRLPENLDLEGDLSDPYANYSIDDLIESLVQLKPSSVSKSNYEYSNYGAGILGYILCHQNKQSYEDMLSSYITGLWKMNNTYINLPKSQNENIAQGHQANLPTSSWQFTDALAGAGAMKSTAADMAIFLSHQLGFSDDIMTDAIQLSQQTHFQQKQTRLGLGWHTYKKNVYWHNGGTGGFCSFTGFDIEKKKAIVLLTNSTHSMDNLGMHWLDGTIPLTKIRKEIAEDRKTLSEYVGKYNLADMAMFTIELKEDLIYVALTGQDAFPIYPEKKDHFFYKILDAQITFRRDETGKINALTLHQAGVDQLANKIE